MGRWGWRGVRDITLITDERGGQREGQRGKRKGKKKERRRSGKPCAGISLPYNLPLQMWAWLLTSPYTWAKWEWAPGTSQTRPMHNSWPLPWRDERKEGSNTGERGKMSSTLTHPHLPPFFASPSLFLDVWLLSLGPNEPRLKARQHNSTPCAESCGATLHMVCRNIFSRLPSKGGHYPMFGERTERALPCL